MPFEPFVKPHRRSLNDVPYPCVSWQSSQGRLAFNDATLALLGITQLPGMLLLSFDSDTGRVGLKRVDAGDTELHQYALLLRGISDHACASVAGRGFARQFGIDVRQVTGYPRATLDPATGLVVFSLPAGSWRITVPVHIATDTITLEPPVEPEPRPHKGMSLEEIRATATDAPPPKMVSKPKTKRKQRKPATARPKREPPKREMASLRDDIGYDYRAPEMVTAANGKPLSKVVRDKLTAAAGRDRARLAGQGSS